MTIALRAVAILIAVGGLIDPAFTMTSRVRARVALVVQDGPTMELPLVGGPERAALPLSNGSRRDQAERVRAQLLKDLGRDYDVRPRLTSDAEAAIMIGDSYPRAT